MSTFDKIADALFGLWALSMLAVGVGGIGFIIVQLLDSLASI